VNTSLNPTSFLAWSGKRLGRKAGSNLKVSLGISKQRLGHAGLVISYSLQNITFSPHRTRTGRRGSEGKRRKARTRIKSYGKRQMDPPA